MIISNNSALTSTQGLGGALQGELEGSVTVSRNPRLELLLGFEQVTALQHDVQGNALVLQHNDMMRHVDTLRNCTAMSGALVVKANARLRSLEGCMRCSPLRAATSWVTRCSSSATARCGTSKA